MFLTNLLSTFPGSNLTATSTTTYTTTSGSVTQALTSIATTTAQVASSNWTVITLIIMLLTAVGISTLFLKKKKDAKQYQKEWEAQHKK